MNRAYHRPLVLGGGCGMVALGTVEMWLDRSGAGSTVMFALMVTPFIFLVGSYGAVTARSN